MPRPQVHPATHAIVLDERTLVERIQSGDRSALEQLFRAHYDGLCAFTLRYVKSAEVAEDLVQDVFLWIWEHRAEWAPREGVRSYLYGAVRNQAFNRARGERVVARWMDRALVEPQTAGIGHPPAQADHTVRTRDLARAVDRAIASLPPRQRQVFILRRQHGLSQIEVARVMGVTVKCVEVHFGKALAALRRELAGFF